MMRERKSSHKKCKSLKRGLQIFLPILGHFLWTPGRGDIVTDVLFEIRSNSI